ncbi:MAG: D-sedoheptulose 7-phosphate isomerase [Paludibacteraceae bacterium]|nr:D-sedoheptulose 7-phosphate isomerase [Paludibacteraceae bacterium]
MDNTISEGIAASIAVKQAIAADENLQNRMREVAEVMIKTLRAGGKVLFCGNGGSAADAQHLAAELSGRFYYDRPPLYAEALHCNTSFLTAVGNDYGYDRIYARMIQGSGRKGDVLVGISTSGNSENILKAFEVARSIGMTVVGMTGASGGKMKQEADILLNAPSIDTPRIQEAHIMMGHLICECVESALFPH